MVNKFTQKAQCALSSALKAAEELGHSYIGTEHLLLGLTVQRDSIASRILSAHGVSEAKIRKELAESMGVGAKGDIGTEDMTPRMHRIIESASEEAKRCGVRYVGTEHLLSALLNRRDCAAIRLLEADGTAVAEIKAELAAYLGSVPSRVRESAARSEEQTKKPKKTSLLSYGRDLNELAREGKTDPVICREKETERLIRILCRRSKNNPCLIGEPGVGKTAVVEGLATRIVNGSVPTELLDKRIVTLDISSMIAGAKFRGEFEDRIKNVIEEVRQDPDIILFVDEMHVMVGAGAAEGAIDASNILKPPLARGEIRMIGATTPSEYRTHIEKDPAFERRFQPVMLEEPNEDDTIRILLGLKERYELHHGIRITDEAIHEAVRLSVRYIHDRFLPDKAIDLIDEAAARLKLSSARTDVHFSTTQLIDELEYKKEAAVKCGDIEAAVKLSENEKELISERKLLALKCTPDYAPTLHEDGVATIISEQTGIPCQRLTASDNTKLAHLESSLSSRVIGQEKAIRAVVRYVKRARTGLGPPNKPSGSFLFLGSSGVGKTELCKALADTLFESKDALIRIDMSEYTEKHSVSKLIGAPPGYVGYGEGGILTEKVRRHPYSVILFDEIEKAYPDIFHVLLQILEDGRLTDSMGRACDFSSSVIIMTSNLLSSDDIVPRTLGFGETRQGNNRNELREHPKLKEFFKPEFLGRIDDLILFSNLGLSELTQISDIMLKELCNRSSQIGVALEIEDNVSLMLAKKCTSEHAGLGARPLRREISELIEAPIADCIVNRNIDTPCRVRISVNENSINLSLES